MRGLLFVIASFGVTILAWGLYGPTLHIGQEEMAIAPLKYARLRPFVCVGLAYFAIAVVVPAVILATRGEKGVWTMRGALMSLFAGALGAIGALGIIMAFTFGGKPSFVMPLVFGGAPVVNSFLTIYWSKRMKEIGPLFLAGLIMVVLGAVTVLTFKPGKPKPAAAPEAVAVVAEAGESVSEEVLAEADKAAAAGGSWLMQIASIATVVLCWGAYGPVLHHGQAAMQQSRLRPLLCVGLAYFAIAVVVPWLLLSGPLPETSEYNFSGTAWSLAAGAAGAIGALGIILAFNFGGRPVYVMPLVFGGAPVVNTFATIIARGQLDQVSAWFLAGLILVIAGAAMVLVFAPKGPPPKKPAEPTPEPKTEPEPTPPAGDNPVSG
ncbi:hypothetical protein MalM25_24610 [Planctomycetes bacterium MalM25]|nr:hypothetical protein MalM25_24610 [Planctomycetes bacterium MalM25]